VTGIIGHVTEKQGRPTPSLGRPLKVFGNPTRTGVLIALALLDESYPRELARLLKTSLSAVQLAVRGLEREGVLATRLLGSERRVTLNPRFYAYAPLKELLFKLSEGQPVLIDAIRATRRRPRREGKPL
jgi:DNA-binding transcriptional ArsR family regulator